MLNAWPAYLAYITSFLTIGGAWLAHTGLTDQLSRTDSLFLRLNLLVLMVVVFLPIPVPAHCRLPCATPATNGCT